DEGDDFALLDELLHERPVARGIAAVVPRQMLDGMAVEAAVVVDPPDPDAHAVRLRLQARPRGTRKGANGGDANGGLGGADHPARRGRPARRLSADAAAGDGPVAAAPGSRRSRGPAGHLAGTGHPVEVA